MKSNKVKPNDGDWMPRPGQGNSAIPPGLEYLTQIDQLIVKQKTELLEMMTGFETNNKYVVKNSMGQKVFKAKEDTDACTRNCCGARRSFMMHIKDNAKNEVMRILRPFRCTCFGYCCSCVGCCQDELEIQAPVDVPIGYVRQVYNGCTVKYELQDANRTPVLVIVGPHYCRCYMPGKDIPFKLLSLDEHTEVGKISKQWTNLMKELFTDSDNFGIKFPMDLDVRMKAVVLGAVFLIDFMFFEDNEPRPQMHAHAHMDISMG